MEKSYSNRMDYLKRKSRRNFLKRELSNIVQVPPDSFFEPDYNDKFIKLVYDKIENEKVSLIINGKTYNELKIISLDHLKKELSNSNFLSELGILLFHRDREMEAVKLPVKDIYNNLHEFALLTKFIDGTNDFILVGEQCKFGLCIVITEYYYEFIKWG